MIAINCPLDLNCIILQRACTNLTVKMYVKLLMHHFSFQFPILHVSIDTTLEKVVSMSENKEIRVHDLTTQTSVQTIFRKMIQGLGNIHYIYVHCIESSFCNIRSADV